MDVSLLSYPHLGTGTLADSLAAHRREFTAVSLRDLFAMDSNRFDTFSTEACGLLFDYSKNRINERTRDLLLELARDLNLQTRIDEMFSGAPINTTEDRSVMHVALRHRGPDAFPSVAHNVTPDVQDVLSRAAKFSDAVRNEDWRGFDGQPVQDVVNIGIGGSDLGPAMAAHALQAYAHPRLRAHFVSNLDSLQLARILDRCDPRSTLFIVASKTFSTQETLTNAHSARRWLLDAAGGREEAIARHFVAISTQLERTAKFGIARENVFEFWDWVGGRYSVWSAIGMSLIVLIGKEKFAQFLSGASAMDEHFRNAPMGSNIPVLMGLLGVWYRNFFAAATHAVLPYDYALRYFPDYLQQLEMESNGKRALLSGGYAEHDTCPIVWGAPGNNGQHAFYQLLHQGTQLVPSDFIVSVRSQAALPGHESACIANALAQTEALMRGRNAEEARGELAQKGYSGEALEQAVAHRVMPGNQPSNTLLYERLTPEILGSLVALYEHKVFVQSVCWGINAFDQWGVELGKELAQRIEPELQGDADVSEHDASTLGLIAAIRRLRER